jgi:dTDP-4-amino-4,6-dideoxygalactose transaminase
VSVPFLDVQATYAELRTELDAAYSRVMRSGQYILGPEVQAFEEAFAAYCGVSYCVGVGNGLDALQIALRAYGIGPGDEVIVPAHTFIATWLAVQTAGATPVPVDVDAVTRNIDAAAVARALSSRTRAIVPVHLYGLPVDMAPLLALARERGIAVIEDAAQAHGARCHGRRAGALADAAAWSFYPGKNLGAFGDGGAITTNDEAIAQEARSMRSYGGTVKYVHETFGLNSRLDPLQAAFLRVKLAHLDEWNGRRRAVAAFYADRLQGLSGLRLPLVPSSVEASWHLFVVEHQERVALMNLLARRGIATLIHYPIPPHLSGVCKPLGWPAGSFPVAEKLAATVLSLPMGPHLTSSQAALVVDALLETSTGCRS